ncbi:MAG TPA: universal stress protein [Puia sp.]|jgi:nucleotide-binding universal stress UspA family protein|nr:universal stress protein [Puia sp.]
MKTVLLPVDFSTASNNAARYAAALSALPEYQIGRIILLNSYHVTIYEQILPTPDLVQVGGREIREKRGGLRKRLQVVREEMLPLIGQAVTIEVIESDEPLLRSILNVIADRKPDLLVIGSDSSGAANAGGIDSGGIYFGGTPGEPFLSEIGDRVIGIARISPIPVLIVPGGKAFDGIHRVLLPCDFRNLACLSPLKIFRQEAWWRSRKVLVINVDPAFRRSEPDQRFRAVSTTLEQYLAGIDHEVHYSDETDTLLGILHFAQAEKADLIVALPGKHSFFYSLTHRSISQALVKDGEIPVLILK